MTTYLTERIAIDPEICNEQPIRGMRITFKTILDFLSAGTTTEELLFQYLYWKKKILRLA